jgi:hypothetical protein
VGVLRAPYAHDDGPALLGDGPDHFQVAIVEWLESPDD